MPAGGLIRPYTQPMRPFATYSGLHAPLQANVSQAEENYSQLWLDLQWWWSITLVDAPCCMLWAESCKAYADRR